MSRKSERVKFLLGPGRDMYDGSHDDLGDLGQWWVDMLQVSAVMPSRAVLEVL